MVPPPPQLPCFTREEVAQHKKFKDCWVILHGEVYNVTEWLAKHPGGATVLFHYAGQDASVRYARMKKRKKNNCIVLPPSLGVQRSIRVVTAARRLATAK